MQVIARMPGPMTPRSSWLSLLLGCAVWRSGVAARLEIQQLRGGNPNQPFGPSNPEVLGSSVVRPPSFVGAPPKSAEPELPKLKVPAVPHWVRESDRGFWTTTTMPPRDAELAPLEDAERLDAGRLADSVEGSGYPLPNFSNPREEGDDQGTKKAAAPQLPLPVEQQGASPQERGGAPESRPFPSTHRLHLKPFQGPVPYDGFKRLGCMLVEKETAQSPELGSFLLSSGSSITPEACFSSCKRKPGARVFAVDPSGCYCAPEPFWSGQLERSSCPARGVAAPKVALPGKEHPLFKAYEMQIL